MDTPSAPSASMNSCNRTLTSLSSVPSASKYKIKPVNVFEVLTLVCVPFNSAECMRKSCAENYPRNFSLIKLAEKREKKMAEQLEQAMKAKQEEAKVVQKPQE